MKPQDACYYNATKRNSMSSVFDHIKEFELPKSIADAIRSDMSDKTEDWTKNIWTYRKEDGSMGTFQKEVDIKVKRSHLQLSMQTTRHCIDQYLDFYPNLAISQSSCMRYHCYEKGTDMTRHWDRRADLFPEGNRGIPILSIVGVVKTAEKGGELQFTCPLGDQRNFLQEPDKFVVFPSTFIYDHEVLPIEKGERQSFTFCAY